jgi:hypothetical protein
MHRNVSLIRSLLAIALALLPAGVFAQGSTLSKAVRTSDSMEPALVHSE